MRLADWRGRINGAFARGTARAPSAPPAVEPPAAPSLTRAIPRELGDIDLRLIWQALVRQRKWVIVPTAAVFVLSMVAVNLVTPRYKSEARILIDGRENVFLRPNIDRGEERSTPDAEAIASQVQLLLSRDLALDVIRKNKLDQLPEFDPVLNGPSPWRSVLSLFGIGRDPFKMTPQERVLEAFSQRLTAYAVDKSRVMVVEFQSRDPKLAAQIANSVADEYLVYQRNARQDQAKMAGQWLSGEIEGLRKKVADAEARVEAFRSKSSLFVGTNNTSLSNQQLGELNTQLNNARVQKADAEARARAIAEMLKSGRPVEASEILNSELVRRLSEQRVTLRAQLAEQSATLLSGHPRIKELRAQIADIERQLREEAGKISRSLENDAKVASARVDSLTASLEQLKRHATSTNSQDIQLRALEREAKAQRDLLESYLAKYREATARENIDAAPSEGRIISRAFVSNTPAYPKKLPIVLIATLITLMLTAGYITAAELLRMTSPRLLRDMQDISLAPLPAMRARVTSAVTEVDELAEALRAEGEAARKITVIGAHAGEDVTLTALALARQLSRAAKVVVVDLTMTSSTLTAASIDQGAPGLSDLMQAAASFGQIITKDRLSGVHIVGAGRNPDRALLQFPRLGLAIDALMRAYDHVVLDAGTAIDLPTALIAQNAHAVIVPDPAITPAARAAMRDQLIEVGFAGVTILNGAAQDPELGPAGERIAAA
ncbi:GumC family protein [Afipia sp. TerB]